MLWPETSHFPGNGWYHPLICQLHCPSARASQLSADSLSHPPTWFQHEQMQEVRTVQIKFCHQNVPLQIFFAFLGAEEGWALSSFRLWKGWGPPAFDWPRKLIHIRISMINCNTSLWREQLLVIVLLSWLQARFEEKKKQKFGDCFFPSKIFKPNQ